MMAEVVSTNDTLNRESLRGLVAAAYLFLSASMIGDGIIAIGEAKHLFMRLMEETDSLTLVPNNTSELFLMPQLL